MSEFTIHKWKCDRCDRIMDEKPGYGAHGTHRLHANSDYATAGETLNWKDLCPACNEYLGRLINQIRKDARGSKKHGRD